MADSHTLRELESESDYEQCLELQRLTWGEDFNELVTPTILRISQKVGGIVAGAFDANDRMLGFVYGLTGLRNGRRVNWSHMLAVRPEARGLGLGRDLKLFQRELLLELGVEVVYWTYDPLIARNANLNVNRLGALPEEYVVDMYGTDTGSDLHSGLGTDRFIVAWELDSERVRRALAGETTALPPEPAAGELVCAGDGDALPEEDLPARIWVTIPRDIDGLRDTSMGEAVAWREGTQALLLGLYERGYRASAVARAGDDRYAYRLERSTGDSNATEGAP